LFFQLSTEFCFDPAYQITLTTALEVYITGTHSDLIQLRISNVLNIDITTIRVCP